MEKNKKDRITKGGWRTGTVDEFLGLSAEEAEFVEMKLALLAQSSGNDAPVKYR